MRILSHVRVLLVERDFFFFFYREYYYSAALHLVILLVNVFKTIIVVKLVNNYSN